jgi:hypothetical protein
VNGKGVFIVNKSFGSNKWVGKTKCALDLADGLANPGKKCLLIDWTSARLLPADLDNCIEK